MRYKKEVLDNITSSYKKLSGRILGLSEAFFKDAVDEKKWESFRKLVLDNINSESRQMIAKLEGRNYYEFKVRREEDGKE